MELYFNLDQARSDSSSWFGTLWSLSDGGTLQQASIADLIDYYQQNIHTTPKTQWDAVKWTYSAPPQRGQRKQKERGSGMKVCVADRGTHLGTDRKE